MLSVHGWNKTQIMATYPAIVESSRSLDSAMASKWLPMFRSIGIRGGEVEGALEDECVSSWVNIPCCRSHKEVMAGCNSPMSRRFLTLSHTPMCKGISSGCCEKTQWFR
jgi:hypothetical protein